MHLQERVTSAVLLVLHPIISGQMSPMQMSPGNSGPPLTPRGISFLQPGRQGSFQVFLSVDTVTAEAQTGGQQQHRTDRFSSSDSVPHSCPLLTQRSNKSPEHYGSTEARFPNLPTADSSGRSWQEPFSPGSGILLRREAVTKIKTRKLT